MTETRSQAAAAFGLFAQTPRSDPPAKAGAGFGPFWLGMGPVLRGAVLAAVDQARRQLLASVAAP